MINEMHTITIRGNAFAAVQPEVLSRFLNRKTAVNLSMTHLNYSHIITFFADLVANTNIKHLDIQSQDITIVPSSMQCTSARSLQSLTLVNCKMTYEQKRGIRYHFPHSNILVSKKTDEVALFKTRNFFPSTDCLIDQQ